MAGKLRDVNDAEADWRSNRERLGYPTFTSHGLRKTCATALDVAGVSARGIAKYLGHKRPSMIQDVYLCGTGTRSAQANRSGGPHGARTHDPRIKSPMLYRLS